MRGARGSQHTVRSNHVLSSPSHLFSFICTYIYSYYMYQRQHQWQPCAEYVQHELTNSNKTNIHLVILYIGIQRERELLHLSPSPSHH